MGSLFIFIRHVGVPVKCSPCFNDRTQTGSVMRAMLRMMMDHVTLGLCFISYIDICGTLLHAECVQQNTESCIAVGQRVMSWKQEGTLTSWIHTNNTVISLGGGGLPGLIWERQECP